MSTYLHAVVSENERQTFDSCVLELDVASAQPPAPISPTNIQNKAKTKG